MGTTRNRNRTHGTGTVIARKNGTFTAQITDGGRRSIGTFPSRAAAEKALAVALVEGPPPTVDRTFGEYLTEWLADQSLQVKATTAARNRVMIRNWVMGHQIARRKVRDLKPEHFRALYRELADHVRSPRGTCHEAAWSRSKASSTSGK